MCSKWQENSKISWQRQSSPAASDLINSCDTLFCASTFSIYRTTQALIASFSQATSVGAYSRPEPVFLLLRPSCFLAGDLSTSITQQQFPPQLGISRWERNETSPAPVPLRPFLALFSILSHLLDLFVERRPGLSEGWGWVGGGQSAFKWADKPHF